MVVSAPSLDSFGQPLKFVRFGLDNIYGLVGE